MKFLTTITPFENNDKLKWRLFLDDEANQLVVFDDSTNTEISFSECDNEEDAWIAVYKAVSNNSRLANKI